MQDLAHSVYLYHVHVSAMFSCLCHVLLTQINDSGLPVLEHAQHLVLSCADIITASLPWSRKHALSA
jgi:hypothetical protein